jgi:hypothetical protein
VGSGLSKWSRNQFLCRLGNRDARPPLYGGEAVEAEGMSFLGPGEEVACAWDNLDDLASSLREKGHKRGILVKVRYEDLAGESYETEWRINPLIYEHNRHVPLS